MNKISFMARSHIFQGKKSLLCYLQWFVQKWTSKFGRKIGDSPCTIIIICTFLKIKANILNPYFITTFYDSTSQVLYCFVLVFRPQYPTLSSYFIPRRRDLGMTLHSPRKIRNWRKKMSGTPYAGNKIH